MLTEYFLDETLKILCSAKSEHRHTKKLIENIGMILSWYKNAISESDFPMQLKGKFDVAYFLYEKRTIESKFSFDDFVENLSNGKYSDIVKFLYKSCNVEFEDEDIEKLFAKFLNKKQLITLMKDKDKLKKLILDVETENYTSEDEIISEWTNTIQDTYTKVQEVSQYNSLINISSLDLANDDFTSVMSDLKNTMTNTDIVDPGIPYLNKKLSSGGFEKRRLYLIGGPSGTGKSLCLNQLMVNAVKNNKGTGEPDTFLYITAENLIGESLFRYYCSMTETPSSILQEYIASGKVKSDPNFNKDLKKDIADILQKKNANVIMKYVQAKRTTVKDVEAIIDEVKSNHNLKAVYIDYLDLFISRQDYHDERIMLGEVAQYFKNLAVAYAIPIITATQLNRSGYNPDGTPSLTQMSESMRKVDSSDVVMFLQPESIPTFYSNRYMVGFTPIKMTILKNRNGPVSYEGSATLGIKMYRSIEDVDEAGVFDFTFTDITTEFLNRDSEDNFDMEHFDPKDAFVI